MLYYLFEKLMLYVIFPAIIFWLIYVPVSRELQTILDTLQTLGG